MGLNRTVFQHSSTRWIIHLLCLLFSDDDDCVECEVVLEALEEIDDEADLFGKSLNYNTF